MKIEANNLAVDPIRAEAMHIAREIHGTRAPARKVIDTALMLEVYFLGASHQWGGTPSKGGAYTLSRIAASKRNIADCDYEDDSPDEAQMAHKSDEGEQHG